MFVGGPVSYAMKRAGYGRTPSTNRRHFGGRFLLFVMGFVLAAGAGAFGYFAGTFSGNYSLAQAGAIAAPTSFMTGAVTSASVNLSWTAPSNPSPTSYTLSQSPGTIAGCSSAPSAGTTSCTATGLSADTSYTWTLTAVYDSWNSTSATASVTTSSPSVPSGALVVNNNPTQSGLPSACATPAYPTIQTAVSAATSGATIYVCAGTYDESVTIDLPLTLDGAEYGVPVSSTSPRSGPETIIDSSGGITYATGATTGTISGFDMYGYSGSGTGEIDADPGLSGVGSGWTFTDNIIDVSNGGIGLNTDNVAGPSPTTISGNEFTQSTPAGESGTGWEGQAVTIWGDPGDNVSITGNDFDNLSGPGAAINTSGTLSCDGLGSGSSQSLSITSNTWEDNGTGGTDENFVALFCTTDASITGNTLAITDSTDANAESPIYLGGGNISPVISGNTETGDGAPGAAGVEVNTAFYPTDNATVENNKITGFNWGVLVYGGYGSPDPYAAPSGFTIEGNTITGAADGIDIYNDGFTYDGSPNYPSGTITHNAVTGSTTDDCVDQTTGSGTLGTNDTWTANIGANSSPTGLCGQGNWVGIYGSSGYILGGWNPPATQYPPDSPSSDLSGSLPSGVTYSVAYPSPADTVATRYQWANPTSDPRALESPDTTTREATCWYDNSTFTITLSFTSAFSGNLELYAIDWDSRNRNETITVTDSSGPTAHTLSSFVNGAWVVQPITVSSGGTVTITVVHNAGDNAVLSGLFLN
jgi:hypothetical protein